MMVHALGQLTVDRALRSIAAEVPTREFLCWNDEWLTYREFDSRVSRFANAIRSRGVTPGSHVLVRLPNSPSHLVVLLGLHRAGCVYVACSPLLSRDQVAYQLAHSDAVAAVCSGDEAGMFAGLAQEVEQDVAVISYGPGADVGGPSVDLEEILADADESWSEPSPPADRLASIVYTSGSTGRPKGVMWSHGFFYAKGRRVKDAFEYGHQDRLLNFFPLSHSNGGSSLVVPPILVGGSIVLEPRFSASRFVSTVAEKGVTVVGLNATHVKILLARPRTDRDADHSVSRAQFSLQLEPERRREFTDRFGIRLAEVYGMTETGIICSSPLWANHSDDSCGLPLPGAQVKLVAEGGGSPGPGEPGQIFVRSDAPHSLASGYYKDPDATRDLFDDGWVRTGDFGRINGYGYLEHAGRMFDTIKRSGYNIAPAEVERVLMEHDRVTAAVVVGIPDAMHESALVAYVTFDDAGQGRPAEQEVVEFCRERLAPHQVPQHVVRLERIPESELGKTDKILLRKLATERFVDATVGGRR
jgi:crotonobetaine/carnitine-CoA ligase